MYKSTNVATNPTNDKCLFPELSYNVIGACFDAYNEMGSGHKEKIYQKAVAEHLAHRGIKFKREVYCPIRCQQKHIGDYVFDFLVENKIVVELKVRGRFRKPDYDQIKAYLHSSRVPLGILVRFDTEGVTFHRVLRPQEIVDL